MLNVGMFEFAIFAILALIVLGPEKLPKAIRTAMHYYRKIKHLIQNVQQDIERELEIAEIREKMDKELAKIRDIETKMQAQLNQIQQNVEQLENADSNTVMPSAPSNRVKPTINIQQQELDTLIDDVQQQNAEQKKVISA